MSFVHRIEELVAETGSGLTDKATHWERIPLGVIADVINGFPFPSGGFNNEEVGERVVRIRDVTSGEVSTYFKGSVAGAPRIEHGDLVIGMDGDFNSRLWPGETALMNQRVCKVAPDERFYSKTLLAYALPGYLKLINDYTSAITVKHLSSKTVQAIPLALPPRAEQERLASKIDELFSRIDEGERALERVARLVERYRQSVLKAAVSGELTRGWREARKAAGQPIESGEALLTRILTARREAWEQAELAKMRAKGVTPRSDAWKKKYKDPPPHNTADLPELPEGWVWASPVQIESTTANALTIGPFGSNLKVADYTNEGVPLIFVRNIRSQSFSGGNAKFVSTKKAAELASHLARAGDVLITKMGDPPGDACVYPMKSPDAVITADCIKWTLHPMMPSAGYVAHFVNSAVGRTQIERITKGVAQQKVSLDRFRQIGIALPGVLEQQEITERIAIELQRLESTADSVKVELKRANALRQGLLKAAFSGQLVEQDPADEPVSALLERIAAERAATNCAAPKRVRKKKSA